MLQDKDELEFEEEETEDFDASFDEPEEDIEEDTEGLEDNEMDVEAATKRFEEDEKYDEEVEAGEWGVQDLTNIAAGAGAGVARAFTGTLSLAADLADIGAEAAGFEGFEDKTLESIHSALDLSDNIAEVTGADENAQAFKTSRAISEAVTIGIQMVFGVGAVSAGAKMSKALIKTGGIKGVGRIAKKGAQTLAKGSKKEVAAKGAAVVAGEEFVSQENANEGGFIINRFLRDSEEADKAIDEIHDPVMGIINRSDPDFAMVADEYMAVNPKNEKAAFKRLENRLESIVDGLAFGAVAGVGMKAAGKVLSAADLGKYFRSVKQTKVNANVARDHKLDQAFIAKKVKNMAIKGEEVTDEAMEGFKKEAKEARKKALADSQEKITAIYEKDIFGKTGTLEEVRKTVEKTSDFFEDENMAALFTRASLGRGLNETKSTFVNKAGETITRESSDIQTFRKLARTNSGVAKLTNKKAEFWKKASDRDIAKVLTDKRFLERIQSKFNADRLLITDKRLELSDKMSTVKNSIADFQAEGSVPSRLLMSQQALIAADAALDLKGSAMNSLAGQFLRLAKDDKGQSIAAINRFVATQAKKYKGDVEFARFEAKMFGDAAFRKDQMGIVETTKLMQKADLMHDFYRQHLLTSIKGVVRNVSEGVVLSGVRIARDVIADKRSVEAIRNTFNRDNTIIAFSRFKKAMQGQSDFNNSSKLGSSAIMEHADVEGSLKNALLNVTAMGRRSVIAGDKLISTYNEAYFMNKHMLSGFETLNKNIASGKMGGLMVKLANQANLTPGEMRLFNEIKTIGVDPVEFLQGVRKNGWDDSLKLAMDKVRTEPGLIANSKKYADKIAMNMEIEDMGTLARTMAPAAEFIGNSRFTRMFMPFPRPALSALDETIEWTPLMNLPRLHKRFTNGSTREKKEAVAQAGMSMVGGTAVWKLFSEGVLTGNGPKDPRANGAWRQFNNPNSIKINGNDYNIQGTVLGSIGTIIGEAHDLMVLHEDGTVETEEKMKLLTAGLTSIFTEIPSGFWTDSLDPLLRIIKDGGGSRSKESAQAAIINNLIKSVPGAGLGIQVGSQVKSGVEESRSDTATRTGNETLQRAWNEFQKNMPFMDVPKRVSFITGEDLQTGATWKKPVLSMNDFDSPKHKDVGDYINAIIQETGAKTSRSNLDYLRFTDPERTISSTEFTGVKSNSYKLSADEYEKLCKLTAHPTGFPPMVDEIRDVMDEMPLDELKDQPQKFKDMAVSLIKEIMTEYKSAAREQFMEESEDYQTWARDTQTDELDRDEEAANFNI